MPIYTFYNEKTDEYRDFLQGMNDTHQYIDETGYKWQRIWHKPQACIDSKFSPWDQTKFVEKTGKMRGTIGNLQDYSRELSEKRAKDHGGRDPISEKSKARWSKERGGRPWRDYKEKSVTFDIVKKQATVS